MNLLKKNVSKDAPKMKKNAALEMTQTDAVSADEIKENLERAPNSSS